MEDIVEGMADSPPAGLKLKSNCRKAKGTLNLTDDISSTGTTKVAEMRCRLSDISPEPFSSQPATQRPSSSENGPAEGEARLEQTSCDRFPSPAKCVPLSTYVHGDEVASFAEADPENVGDLSQTVSGMHISGMRTTGVNAGSEGVDEEACEDGIEEADEDGVEEADEDGVKEADEDGVEEVDEDGVEEAAGEEKIEEEDDDVDDYEDDDGAFNLVGCSYGQCDDEDDDDDGEENEADWDECDGPEAEQDIVDPNMIIVFCDAESNPVHSADNGAVSSPHRNCRVSFKADNELCTVYHLPPGEDRSCPYQRDQERFRRRIRQVESEIGPTLLEKIARGPDYVLPGCPIQATDSS